MENIEEPKKRKRKKRTKKQLRKEYARRKKKTIVATRLRKEQQALAKKEKEKKEERAYFYKATQEYKDEVKWLLFLCKPLEEQEAILEKLRKGHHRLPIGFRQDRWIKLQKEKAAKHQAERKAQLKVERKKRARINKKIRRRNIKDHNKYGEENLTLRRRKTIYNYRWQRAKRQAKYDAEYKRRIAEGDEYGSFTILRFKDKAQRLVLYHQQWKNDILPKYEKLLADNRASVRLPDNRKSFHYEIMLIRSAKPNEVPETYIRNEEGKNVKYILNSDPDAIILRKDDWYVEEKFVIFGKHQRKEKIDYTFIYNLLTQEDKEKYESDKVLTYRDRLIIYRAEGDYDIIKCRTITVAQHLYDMLLEDVTNNRVYGHFFLGEMKKSSFLSLL